MHNTHEDQEATQITVQTVATNYSFQNIAKLLRENQEKSQTADLQQRCQKLKLQRDKLLQLTDMDTMIGTQKAVEDRMGPQMCDNSMEERSKMKNKFLSVLKDYQQKINMAIKSEKQLVVNVKERFSLKLVQLQNQIKSAKQNQERKIELQRQKLKEHKLNYLQQIRDLKCSQALNKIQASLYNFQSQMDVKVLQVELLKRKRMEYINSKIVKLKKLLFMNQNI